MQGHTSNESELPTRTVSERVRSPTIHPMQQVYTIWMIGDSITRLRFAATLCGVIRAGGEITTCDVGPKSRGTHLGYDHSI
jgi:hypothetical protein